MIAVKGHSRITRMSQVMRELISAGLSLVRLLVRNTSCAHQETRDNLPFWANVVDWTSPSGSYCECKMHLNNDHRGTLKKESLITYKAWRVYSLGSTQWCFRKREKEKEREKTGRENNKRKSIWIRSLLSLGVSVGWLGFHGFILHWWI